VLQVEMRRELESALSHAHSLAAAELPRFLGELEEIRAIAFARLIAPNVPPAQPDEELLDISEAARRLNLSRTTLYALIGRGELKSRTIGRRRMILRAALDAFVRKDHRTRE
jgi:excisionase family DNA binding protein